MIVMLLSLAMSSVVPTGTFDCEINAPRWIDIVDGDVKLRSLKYPALKPDDWKFTIRFDPVSGAMVTPTGADPFGIAGEHGVMTTGESSYALASYASRGCVMTDAGCVTVIQFVTQADGTLKLLAMPSAIISVDGAKIPEAFNAYAPGICIKKEATQ